MGLGTYRSCQDAIHQRPVGSGADGLETELAYRRAGLATDPGTPPQTAGRHQQEGASVPDSALLSALVFGTLSAATLPLGAAIRVAWRPAVAHCLRH
jgi:hypothetical protein